MTTSPGIEPSNEPTDQLDTAPEAEAGAGSRYGRDRQTVELLRRARELGSGRGSVLEEQAVRLNMALARQLAHRYRERGIALDDLRQVAYLGLVKAVRGFDPARNDEFLGYAVPTIRGELRKHFRDAGWTVRPPRRIQELQSQVWATESDLTQELHRSPTAGEIADRLQVGVEDVIEACSADGCFTPSSLDAAPVAGGASLGERQASIDAGFSSSEARVVLGPVVRELGERDRRILELRFFHGWTQAQIGEDVGVTQMQVSRLLARILGDLRERLEVTAA